MIIIRVLSSGMTDTEIQAKLDRFTKENPSVEITNVSLEPCRDYYEDGRVCNQWVYVIITGVSKG